MCTPYLYSKTLKNNFLLYNFSRLQSKENLDSIDERHPSLISASTARTQAFKEKHPQ